LGSLRSSSISSNFHPLAAPKLDRELFIIKYSKIIDLLFLFAFNGQVGGRDRNNIVSQPDGRLISH
jgi:hypothetical protein